MLNYSRVCLYKFTKPPHPRSSSNVDQMIVIYIVLLTPRCHGWWKGWQGQAKQLNGVVVTIAHKVHSSARSLLIGMRFQWTWLCRGAAQVYRSNRKAVLLGLSKHHWGEYLFSTHHRSREKVRHSVCGRSVGSYLLFVWRINQYYFRHDHGGGRSIGDLRALLFVAWSSWTGSSADVELWIAHYQAIAQNPIEMPLNELDGMQTALCS